MLKLSYLISSSFVSEVMIRHTLFIYLIIEIHSSHHDFLRLFLLTSL